MDYSNAYGLHSLAIYAVRFGYVASWPLAELGPRMSGKPLDLPELRARFAHVLRDELPAYLARRGW